MKLQVFEFREQAERSLAEEIATLVRARPDAVLGLASGATPTGVYRELVRLHREGGLNLSRVRTFNLDEYYGLAPTEPQSFHRAMQTALFEASEMSPTQTLFPAGWANGKIVPLEDVPRHCADFERAIQLAGGIDLQVLGIGRNGHIGFNEPGSTRTSRTRLIELQESTRADASAAFGGIALVPTHAVTMGVGTILDARRVRVLAFGGQKRTVVETTLALRADSAWPASFLHDHPDARLIVDREAVGPDA